MRMDASVQKRLRNNKPLNKVSSVGGQDHCRLSIEMNQADAAKLLGVDQPKVSNIMNGRLSGFSLERLIHFLNVLGREVQIVVRPKPRSQATGRLRVVCA